MDSLQQSKQKKVMGTARSCFYVFGSDEFSRYEGYAEYLVGPGRCYFIMILQYDNARPQVARPLKTYLETLQWEVLPHSLYSADIAPSDYYLFRSMAHGLFDQQFRSYEDIE